MERKKTVCPLDCWDMCGIVATVVGDRVMRLDGDPDDPVARGKLCSRTYRYPERAQASERILHPMKKERGQWRTATWEEALEEIAGRLASLRDAGRTHSVLQVQSAGSMGLLKTLSARFWNLFGGVSVAEGDFCLGAGKDALTAQLGDYRSHDWEDLLHSKLILLWGRDPFVSGPHRLGALRDAQKRGARVVAINPLQLARSSILDETVIIRPGSDGFLAAALLRELLLADRIDRSFVDAHTRGFEPFADALRQLDPSRLAEACNLPPREIARLADLYAEASPAAILLGTGVIRYRHGLETAALTTALPAFCGYYGVSGGGLSYTVRHKRGAAVDDHQEPRPDATSRPFSAGIWHHHIDRLGAAEMPIEFVWVAGANPVAMLPDSAHLARVFADIEFKVIVDFHWTDTARLADWVLPHPSFLEEGGVVSSWGTPYLGYQRAVIARQGESRTDLEIFQALADRLGFGAEMAGDEETWSRKLLGAAATDADWRTLLSDRRKVRNPIHEPVPYAGGRFATADGAYAFPSPGSLPKEGDLPRTSDAHPFLLLTPKSRERHLSQVLPRDEQEMLRGTMATDVAASMGAREGQFQIVSEHGRILAWLREDPQLQPGLIVLPLGGTVARGTAVNLLIGPDCASDGITPAYFDCPVRLEAPRT